MEVHIYCDIMEQKKKTQNRIHINLEFVKS